MVAAAWRNGFSRTEALQAVALACDSVLERYAGTKTLNMAFIKAVRGEANRQLRTSPPDNVLPTRGQGYRKGQAE